MNNLSLRLYSLICMAFFWLRAFGQDDDDDDTDLLSRGGDFEMEDMEDMIQYPSFHIRFSDIMTVIFLLIACYVFGKIWKGCTYLILLVAVIFYFLAR